MGSKYPTCGLPWAQDLICPCKRVKPKPLGSPEFTISLPPPAWYLPPRLSFLLPSLEISLSFSLEFSRKGFSEARVRAQFLSPATPTPDPPGLTESEEPMGHPGARVQKAAGDMVHGSVRGAGVWTQMWSSVDVLTSISGNVQVSAGMPESFVPTSARAWSCGQAVNICALGPG